MKNLFPDVPQDLAKLSVEELGAAIKERQKIVDRAVARDPEILGDLTMDEVIQQVTSGVETIEAMRNELKVRAETEQKFEDEMNKLAEIAGKPEPEAEVKDDAEESEEAVDEAVAEVIAEAEAATAEEAEKVEEPVLAAGHLPAGKAPLPQPTESSKPAIIAESSEPRGVLVASAGIKGFNEGEALDKLKLAEAMIAKRFTGASTQPGVQEKVLVASARYGDLYPDSRRLTGDRTDQQKIDDVVSPEALVASGGLCAPVTPYYELMNVAVADRPVRDSLASFNAVRGGLRFAAPPTIADVTGVGIKTAAQDAAGGTFATKSCQIVSCPSFSEVDLDMIYHCVQFGNLNSRAWPEQVAQFNALVLAAHARLAEQNILDYIESTATAVTEAAIYGAYSSLLDGILFAGAGLRSRNRMAINAKLRVLLPEWVGDLIAADLNNRAFAEPGRVTRGSVASLLEAQDIVVTYYLDTATGKSQVFGAQNAGTLLRFPTTVEWYIFPEGSYLFLDGGVLDLGIVRDSTLNSTNDFQIFGETFENTAFVGVEALAVTSTVCPTGETGPAATAITCS